MTKIVLVVDDESDVRYALRVGLEKRGYKIIEASRAEQALEIIRTKEPDLVIMDVMMPGVGGLEATLMIKKDPDLEHIKVIVLTAKTDPWTKDNAEYCADAYLAKPIEMDTLHDEIQKVLAS